MAPLCLCIALGVMPIDSLPLSVTSYWPFVDGQPMAWAGQADGDPHHYANMQPTSPDHAGQVAACIQDWTRREWTTALSFTWQGQPMTLACWDTFGAESYRQPFYHDGYGKWVIPVDVLSPAPYHGLVRDWQREVVSVP